MSLAMTNIQPQEYMRALNEARQLRAAISFVLVTLSPIVNELNNGLINGGWPCTKGDLRSLATELQAIVQPLREVP